MASPLACAVPRPRIRSDLCCSCPNAGSLTHCARLGIKPVSGICWGSETQLNPLHHSRNSQCAILNKCYYLICVINCNLNFLKKCMLLFKYFKYNKKKPLPCIYLIARQTKSQHFAIFASDILQIQLKCLFNPIHFLPSLKYPLS